MTEQPPGHADSPDIHSVIGGYVLDALEPAERTAFERHLNECGFCRDEVAELTAVASRLSVLTEAEPPASLRERTLEQVHRSTQSPGRARPPRVADAGGLAPLASPARPATADELAVARARRSARITRWIAAAAVVVALAAAGGYAYGQHQIQQAHQQIQAADRLLDAPDLRVAQAPIRGGGHARVLASASHGEMLLAASGLRILDASHTYQVWVMQPSGTATSLGTFGTATGSVHATMRGDVAGPVSIGITVEPAGGSAKPTTKPIFAQKLMRT